MLVLLRCQLLMTPKITIQRRISVNICHNDQYESMMYIKIERVLNGVVWTAMQIVNSKPFI